MPPAYQYATPMRILPCHQMLSPTKKKKEMTGKCENCEAKSFGEKRP